MYRQCNISKSYLYFRKKRAARFSVLTEQQTVVVLVKLLDRNNLLPIVVLKTYNLLDTQRQRYFSAAIVFSDFFLKKRLQASLYMYHVLNMTIVAIFIFSTSSCMWAEDGSTWRRYSASTGAATFIMAVALFYLFGYFSTAFSQVNKTCSKQFAK